MNSRSENYVKFVCRDICMKIRAPRVIFRPYTSRLEKGELVEDGRRERGRGPVGKDEDEDCQPEKSKVKILSYVGSTR